MSENLTWSLSDGAPEVKTLDGKDEQRPPAAPPEHPPNLPAQLRGDEDPPDTDIDWYHLPDPPDLSKPLDAEAFHREREESIHVAEQLRQYIGHGLESDPLAGVATHGGYVTDAE